MSRSIAHVVSIRSRHRCREKHSGGRSICRAARVSIRSRHRCREKRVCQHGESRNQCFNPLPASMPGETVTRLTCAGAFMFQSAPGIDAGRNQVSDEQLIESAVSIRSRHRCREKLGSAGGCRGCFGFQSAPGIDAGRNLLVGASTASCPVSIRSRHRCREKRIELAPPARVWVFQSAPGIDAGRNPRARCSRCHYQGFNPLPASMPGEITSLPGRLESACCA